MIKPTEVKLMKGALVSIPTLPPIPKPIFFQYNPETLRRDVTPNTYGPQDGIRRGPLRFAGAPSENISLELTVSAIDALEKGDLIAETVGVRPQLAALELLAYPSLIDVAKGAAAAALGTVEATPMNASRILFIFGPTRVVPVQLTSLSVNELFFDQLLNPIRASVALTMKTVTYSDVYPTDANYWGYVAHQTVMTANSALYLGEEVKQLLPSLG